MKEFSETLWDELLQQIEDRQVIPIVGSELLRISGPQGAINLHQDLAARLAVKLGITGDFLESEAPIHQVICRHVNSGRPENPYNVLRSILRSLSLPSPQSLRQLAEITQFSLYVSTTFDGLMEQAINEVRFEGDRRAECRSYAPNRVEDLTGPLIAAGTPVVYQLFGRASTSPDYVLTEEDMLEFVAALQSERRPKNLFDELRSKNLLLIGCDYPDWLSRFLIRVFKGDRLSNSRPTREVLADGKTRSCQNLTMFLEHFSRETYLFAQGDASDFVTRLSEKYREAKLDQPGKTGPRPRPDPEMKPGDVFISYAREDAAAAEQLFSGLKSKGINAWFDEDRLEAGDAYDQKIRRSIDNCALFIPVISGNTQRRKKGYFRLEWNLASELTLKIGELRFILPVIVDETAWDDADVPIRFKPYQFSRLPGGSPNDVFVEQVTRALGQYCQQGVVV